jgi:hypothetical protein
VDYVLMFEKDREAGVFPAADRRFADRGAALRRRPELRFDAFHALASRGPRVRALRIHPDAVDQ